MLRIYRVSGALFGVIAVWAAALRSSLQPSYHLAVLLVSPLKVLPRKGCSD